MQEVFGTVTHTVREALDYANRQPFVEVVVIGLTKEGLLLITESNAGASDWLSDRISEQYAFDAVA